MYALPSAVSGHSSLFFYSILFFFSITTTNSCLHNFDTFFNLPKSLNNSCFMILYGKSIISCVGNSNDFYQLIRFDKVFNKIWLNVFQITCPSDSTIYVWSCEKTYYFMHFKLKFKLNTLTFQWVQNKMALQLVRNTVNFFHTLPIWYHEISTSPIIFGHHLLFFYFSKPPCTCFYYKISNSYNYIVFQWVKNKMALQLGNFFI